MSAPKILDPVTIAISDLDLEHRDCPICPDALENHDDCNGTAARLRCGHNFGKECLLTWLEESLTCPMCRAKLDYLAEEYSHRLKLGWWIHSRAYMAENISDLRDEVSTPLVFFRRQLELALEFNPVDGYPHDDMSALIDILLGPLYGLTHRAEDWDWDEYLRFFEWHVRRFSDVVQELSGPIDYSCYQPSPQADGFQILAQIMRAEIAKCFETLRWEAMPDYGLDVLFGTCFE